jgi:Protein of unknown function (DUF2809)
MKFGFHKKYAILSIALFVVEVFIALFIHDGLVRPFVGDMLVVILIFTICRCFINANYFWLALCVLIFSFAVEIGQYFDLISILGLQHCGVARTIIGTTFDYHDLLAYSAGVLLIFIIGLLAKYQDINKQRRLCESRAPDGAGVHETGHSGVTSHD